MHIQVYIGAVSASILNASVQAWFRSVIRGMSCSKAFWQTSVRARLSNRKTCFGSRLIRQANTWRHWKCLEMLEVIPVTIAFRWFLVWSNNWGYCFQINWESQSCFFTSSPVGSAVTNWDWSFTRWKSISGTGTSKEATQKCMSMSRVRTTHEWMFAYCGDGTVVPKCLFFSEVVNMPVISACSKCQQMDINGTMLSQFHTE